MAGKKRRRLLDGGKTVAIVLLACSALYLTGLTQFSDNISSQSWVYRVMHFFDDKSNVAAPSSPTAQGAFLPATIAPVRLMITWGDGHYGVQYSTQVPAFPDGVSTLLAEALSGAEQPRQVPQAAWQAALHAQGLYCDFLGALPLDTLSRWLAGRENTALTGVSAQKLLLTESEQVATLYYINDGDGLYYACDFSFDLSIRLARIAQSHSPNGAAFAANLGEGYTTLLGDTLVLPTPPAPRIITAENPVPLSDDLTLTQELATLFSALAFHPQSNLLYAVGDGGAINDGSETLRLSPQGTVTYHATEGVAPRFPVGTSLIDTTRLLAEATVGALCGDARLYLASVTEQGGVTTATYGYCMDGAAIQVGRDGFAAQFTVSDGIITDLKLQLRHYTAQSATALLLPEEQAAAALSPGQAADSIVLSVRYEDRGDGTLTPFWSASLPK